MPYYGCLHQNHWFPINICHKLPFWGVPHSMPPPSPGPRPTSHPPPRPPPKPAWALAHLGREPPRGSHRLSAGHLGHLAKPLLMKLFNAQIKDRHRTWWTCIGLLMNDRDASDTWLFQMTNIWYYDKQKLTCSEGYREFSPRKSCFTVNHVSRTRKKQGAFGFWFWITCTSTMCTSSIDLTFTGACTWIWSYTIQVGWGGAGNTYWDLGTGLALICRSLSMRIETNWRYKRSKFGDTGYPPEPSVGAANRYFNGVKDLYIFRAGQGDGNIIAGGWDWVKSVQFKELEQRGIKFRDGHVHPYPPCIVRHTHTHLLQVNTVYILRFIHSVNSKPPAKTYITRAPIYASL